MGTKEKLVERLKRRPTDFTFDEAERLLSMLGYIKSNKGKTSGSRVMFIDKQNHKILLHKPHPGNNLKGYALDKIIKEIVRRRNYLIMNTLKYKGYIGSVAQWQNLERIIDLIKYSSERLRVFLIWLPMKENLFRNLQQHSMRLLMIILFSAKNME